MALTVNICDSVALLFNTVRGKSYGIKCVLVIAFVWQKGFFDGWKDGSRLKKDGWIV